jgi:hypothetical protein
MENPLITFFRDLADKIERKELSSEQLKNLGEIYIKDSMISNLQSIEEHLNDEEALLKYITMGWYVYEVLLQKQQLTV